MVARFPNLFLLLGPNTGLGHTSVLVMAEAQVAYIERVLAHAHTQGIATIEPRAEAESSGNAEVHRRMKGTVWTAGGCASWYLDSKGLNTTLWPDFSFRLRRAPSRFDPAEHLLLPGPARTEEVAA